MRVYVDTSGMNALREYLKRLDNPALARAMRQGLNEHVRLQERQAVTMVSGQTKIPTGRVKSISRVMAARGGGGAMQAGVEFKDAAIPLGEHTFRSWSRAMPGASAGDWTTKTYPGTFAVPRWGGRIYKRISKGRFPIQRIWGPVLPNELLRPTQPALPAARRLADTDLERRVLKHVLNALGR